jgi:hypothetical protein
MGLRRTAPPGAFPARLFGQPLRQRQMNHYYHSDMGMKTPCANDVSIIHSPEDLQTGIDTFRSGPALAGSLELLGRPAYRREPPQVLFAVDPHHQAALLPRVR